MGATQDRPEEHALVAQAVHRTFGGVTALDGVTLSVPAGGITGLIGPNGAGKTTLFNTISGVIPVDRGRLSLFGADITGLPSHRIARMGLIRTFQLARELGRLTVLENLMLAPLDQVGERLSGVFFRPRATRAQELAAFARAREVLDLVMLTPLMDANAADLSGGQKKLLELARALMTNPRLILLDEPGAGVNPALMNTLCDTIARLNREQGVTFLIIEHDMNLIARLCHKVVVMAQGRNLVEGSFEDVSRDARVINAYLGSVAA